jgi:hypothetical protein
MGWLIAGSLMLILSISEGLLESISSLVGATLFTSTLFFFGLVFLVTICLHFSIRISSLTNQVRTLTQHMGILYNEKQSLEEQIEQNSLAQHPSKLEKL